jgi:DNA-binding SARP family transcriptional activator
MLISKEILMDLFWPEIEPEAARRNLHQAIYALRQTLKTDGVGFQHILFENDGYKINPALKIWIDFDEFEQRVKIGQELEQRQALDQAMAQFGVAESMYSGDFMAEDPYEDWPQARRQNLWQTYLSVAYRLADYYLTQDQYVAAIVLNQRVLMMDNCQEKAHQNLMRCYLVQGQRHLALRQYQLCAEALRTELELSPSIETKTLYNQIIGQ